MKSISIGWAVYLSCLLGILLPYPNLSAQSYSFTNDETGAPNTDEACPNNQFTFTYNGLSNHPQVIRYNRKGGGTATRTVTPTNRNSNSGQHSGTITASIPRDMISGPWTLERNSGTTLGTTTQIITIHNPEVNFTVQSDPICASDTVLLFGIPSGGSYSVSGAPNSILLSNPTRLNGLDPALWSNDHDSVASISITYSYTPQYTNGNSCPNPIIDTDTITIRDNRLDTIEFKDIFKPTRSGNPNRLFGVDTNTFVRTVPNILPPTAFAHPYSFSGTYITPSNDFLVDQAFGTNFITFRYDNGGCPAEAVGILNVYEPVDIYRLPDTLCNEAAPVSFFRDTSSRIAYRRETSGFLILDIIEYNLIDRVYTRNAANQNAIITVSSTPGSEEYQFDPNQLAANSSDTVIVLMDYKTTRTRRAFGLTFGPSTISQFTVAKQVIIEDRPAVVSVGPLDTAFCKYGGSTTLTPTPGFESPSRTYFSVEGQDLASGQYTLQDTFVQNFILNPEQIYDNLVPAANRNLPMRIVYTVDRFGCQDRDTAYTSIIAPLEPIYYPQPAYCTSDPPSLISTGLRNGTILGVIVQSYFDPIPGLDVNTGLFAPGGQLIGETPLTFTIIDFFGCVSTYTDTIVVRDPPDIELALDGSITQNVFCADVTNVQMSAPIVAGSAVSQVNYFGAGVIDSTFNPNIAFADTSGNGRGRSGTTIVWATVVDSLGCRGADSTVVTILQAPVLDVNAAFLAQGVAYNYIDSAGVPQRINIEHAYCGNDPAFTLSPTPSYTDNSGIQRGVLTGNGVQLVNGVYQYDPRLVTDSVLIDGLSFILDTVVYTYTDSVGCVNTDQTIVQIYRIPEVDMQGIQSSYCLNDPATQVITVPPLSSGTSNSGFRGPGFDPVTQGASVTRNPTFDPSRAALGQNIVSYRFTDTVTNCFNIDYDTFTVNPLPVPRFGGLNRNNQYCTAADTSVLFTLNDTTAPSSYRFWGAVIVDSRGLLVPDTSGGASPAISTQTQVIYYSYTDTLLCSNTDSALIFVSPTPVLTLDGLDSAYCANGTPDRINITYSAQLSNHDTTYSTSGSVLIFDPTQLQLGYNRYTLTYTDPITTCADTISGQTYVRQPPTPSFTSVGQATFDTFYCAISDTIALSGTPIGGTFSGAGMVSTGVGTYGFFPFITGNGRHTVSYAIPDTFNYTTAIGTNYDLICIADTQVNVIVRPVPRADIQRPVDRMRFCSNDQAVLLEPVSNVDSVVHLFSNGNGRVFQQLDFVREDSVWFFNRWILDTVFAINYYFNPDSASSQRTLTDYTVTHTVTNIYGCSDTAHYVYSVNLYEPPYFQLDSVFCQGDPPTFLTGNPSSNGVFLQNGDTMRLDPNTRVITYYPIPNVLPNGTHAITYDTLNYSYDNGVCAGDTTVIVRINPTPVVDFVNSGGLDTFCLGGNSVQLIPSVSGGVFSGNGVPFGSTTFIPDNAGAGVHPINYNFTDTSTGCSTVYQRLFSVYGMPNVDYAVVGGCQLDSIRFIVNNDILGLNNIFQNRIIDSITSVQWVLEPSGTLQGTTDGTSIDSIGYVYTTHGIYNTQLIVANQVHCVDTHEVRLVISPTINTFPYDESFEANHGNWYPESRGATYPLLWDWGMDSTAAGIPTDLTNHIWVTGLNQVYQASEDAWVYSPCFDMQSLNRPMISFDYFLDAQSTDGALLEYQRDDGTWMPLGELNRGINWFNSNLIVGQPGDQHLPPIGWTGKSTTWTNARYKLDDYAGADNTLRLRMAFGSSQLPVTTFYDGFAFDNVWIGERSRNVLLETTSNVAEPSMAAINRHVYNLVFHTELNKDVTMIQYHTDEPDANDQFYLNMEAISNLRTFDYNSKEAGRGYIDGSFVDFASTLTDADFEVDMLQHPKFDIKINGGLQYIASQQTFILEATVTALEDMPELNYRIYTSITEDSLSYTNNLSYTDEVHAVVRQDDDNANLMRRAWTAGDSATVTLVWDHSNDAHINYRAGRFQGVVFIQAKESSNKEVFQVATTRDVSGYVGVKPTDPIAHQQYHELQDLVLFPNPTRDYFQVRFQTPLSTNYEWKLINMQGITVQTGQLEAGTQQLQVEGLSCPAGTYILSIYNGQVFTERKVVIYR